MKKVLFANSPCWGQKIQSYSPGSDLDVSGGVLAHHDPEQGARVVFQLGLVSCCSLAEFASHIDKPSVHERTVDTIQSRVRDGDLREAPYEMLDSQAGAHVRPGSRACAVAYGRDKNL